MAKIGLTLDRQDVSVEDFTEAFNAQVRLVTLVMIEMSLPANEVRWIISDLGYSSASAAATAQRQGEHIFMADIESAIANAGRGLRLLGSSPERPRFFNDEALKTASRLAQITTAFDRGRTQLVFGSTEVKPTAQVTEHVNTIIKGTIRSIGSIEGKLVGVRGSDGSYHLFVRDRLRNQEVRCIITEDQLQVALEHYERRVIVRGVLWSRHDGSALRIVVKNLEFIPADEELPTRGQVGGILKGWRLADGE